MPESSRGRLLRWAAATMAIAAGAVHLAQVGVHTDEDPRFGLFFLVVAMLQLIGGAYLIQPIGPKRIARSIVVFGIAGSVATIAVWATSRTFGLPFGAEPGAAEEVGLADAAASVFELFTAFLLFLWLRQERLAERAWRQWSAGGAATAAIFGALWIVLRSLEVLDPDPRLLREQSLADVAAVGFLVVVALFFGRLAVPHARAPGRLGSALILMTLIVVEAPLVAFTIPARGGQNLDCVYAPIAEDSGISHARPPEPIEMDVGERRSVVVLLLTACADAPVELASVSPIRPRGTGVEIESVSIDRTRTYRVDRVRGSPGAKAEPASGFRLMPGAGRYPVVIDVRAVSEGRLDLPAWRVEFVYKGAASDFGFASFTSFCVGHDACEEEP